MSASEKEKKSFLPVGVAKINFSDSLSRKRASRKIISSKLNLFLFLTNVQIAQKK
jgi:hypothetical protein